MRRVVLEESGFAKWVFPVCAVGLLVVFASLLLSVSVSTSQVWDEPNGIALGYYFLVSHDYRLNMGHPPLGFMLSGAPLLFIDAPLPDNAAAYADYSYNAFSQDFFSMGNDVTRYLTLGRAASILLSVGAAALIFIWALRLYGRAAALFSTALFAFSPVVIGNSATAVNDVIVSFFILLTLLLFWRHMANPRIISAVLVTFSFSLAVLSKLTGLFILPMFLLLWAAHLRGSQQAVFSKYSLRQVLLFGAMLGVVFFVTALVVFSFQFGSINQALPEHQAPVLNAALDQLPGPLADMGHALLSIPLPFPSFFVALLQGSALAVFAPKMAFFLGTVYEGGRWYYFPAEFLLKNSLFFLAAIAAALFSLKMRRLRFNELFLLVPAGVYFALFLPMNENFGMRHLLPVFPFLCIFAGRIFRSGFWRAGIFSMVIIVGLVSQVALVHPDEFAYFNELVGPQRGHVFFVGGNLDSGQGLIALRDYMRANEINSLKLSYFGSLDPALYGINYTYLPAPFWQAWDPHFAPSGNLLGENFTEDCRPSEGIIAVSATNLKGVNLINQSCYSWLDEYEPVALVAHSIFIYDVSDGS